MNLFAMLIPKLLKPGAHTKNYGKAKAEITVITKNIYFDMRIQYYFEEIVAKEKSNIVKKSC